jgi:hypothetical protein
MHSGKKFMGIKLQQTGSKYFECNQHKIVSKIVNLLLLLLSLLSLLSLVTGFLPGISLEPAVTPTAQASSFTLQYFPYYV